MKKTKKKLVISSSASLKLEIEKWIKYFRERDFDILNYPFQIKRNNFSREWSTIHKNFYKSLKKSDIHFIANEDKNKISGYIGVGVLAELAFTIGLKLNNKNIRIILYKKPSVKSLFYKDINLWIKNGWLEIFDKKEFEKQKI